ncbi:MAG: CRISPR-associated endonuclease Cas2 [Deltaproteobacteria bacterium]|jgi:CRISPR-associated protein Cas2|nr:CRISPR-associated endonuclease Cas2 [Deltaproteobacteria bacterium]MBQ33093.1 CRISPR-associated endonuclease Cas2 [Deltaproteobacteria bacterium]MDP7629167.1 CRISPR-associated endonuclease Cas2 [SAR324 cluster bacterium]|tara:strand:- start:200 stop:490 length:291 start_codon:yes stop_codon:yes gene_type:complete
MLILVSYDVSTVEKEGRRRLRRVAKACQNFGQRVQFSVFECQVNEMQREELERILLEIIDEDEDSLRFYRLTEPLEKHRQEYGKKKAVDFEDVLLL